MELIVIVRYYSNEEMRSSSYQDRSRRSNTCGSSILVFEVPACDLLPDAGALGASRILRVKYDLLPSVRVKHIDKTQQVVLDARQPEVVTEQHSTRS